MTDQHPITPPPELVQQWRNAAPPFGLNRETWIATQAARWGADQQLEACANWLADPCAADMPYLVKDLRYSRRPKMNEVTLMAELSPQAQAVLDAILEISPAPADEIAAAALRAAADQVVPGDGSRRANEIRSDLLAIATELESVNG